MGKIENEERSHLHWRRLAENNLGDLKILCWRKGRMVLAVRYKVDEQSEGKLKGSILVICLETKDGYSRPFYICYTTGRDHSGVSLISTAELPLGLTASYYWDGTGAMREHMLFDVAGRNPRFIAKEQFGRIRFSDPKGDPKAYQDLHNARAANEGRFLRGASMK